MRTIFICSLLSVAALAGCGGASETEGAGPVIVATTGVMADFASQIAGPRAEIRQLIPDGSSPHDFQLSGQDRLALEEADLVIANGAGLEAGVPLDDVDAPLWFLSDHAGDLRAFDEAGVNAEHEDEENAAEGDYAVDPHLWMDPTRVVAALPSLSDALARTDPSAAAGYRERGRRFARRLQRLDSELGALLSSVSPTDRELITSHDSLGYFADRYGFEVIATAFPATGPEAEASASLIRDVQRAVRENEVAAVFAQQEDEPEALELIAEETGAEIEDGLIVESPDAAGSYVEMLRLDARLIAQGLR